jgi:hypothetical protein
LRLSDDPDYALWTFDPKANTLTAEYAPSFGERVQFPFDSVGSSA